MKPCLFSAAFQNLYFEQYLLTLNPNGEKPTEFSIIPLTYMFAIEYLMHDVFNIVMENIVSVSFILVLSINYLLFEYKYNNVSSSYHTRAMITDEFPTIIKTVEYICTIQSGMSLRLVKFREPVTVTENSSLFFKVLYVRV